MSATHHRNECMPIADDRNVYVHDDLFRGNLYGEHNNKPKYGVYCQLYGWPHVERVGLCLFGYGYVEWNKLCAKNPRLRITDANYQRQLPMSTLHQRHKRMPAADNRNLHIHHQLFRTDLCSEHVEQSKQCMRRSAASRMLCMAIRIHTRYPRSHAQRNNKKQQSACDARV